ncbi:MAG: hypothetical protein Q4D29_01360 [Lachnospiraceae bacterium]|nr:hypothetical protein [Lachnospiraceae bacterium]
MIEKLMSLNHFTYKKPFSGSDKGNRFKYIIQMVVKEIYPEVPELFEGSREDISEGMKDVEPVKVKVFNVTCWSGEKNSKNTPDEEKQIREFEFSEEGYEEALKWLQEESDKIA